MEEQTREQIKDVVARSLGIEPSTLIDATDISAINPVDLRVALIVKLGFCHGGADGDPKTFGELIRALTEVQRMLAGPKITIQV